MSHFKSVVSKSLGNLISWEKIQHGIIGKTTHGQFRVLQYDQHVFRITITQEDFFEDFSYSVVAQPSGNGEIVDNENQLTFSTTYVKLIIQKHPVRFSFYTTNDQLINQDDALGTSWNGDQVTTYKTLQEGERFIGLGEKTGPLDRRGLGYQNWNTDHFAYHASADPLYCSIPFYMGLHHNLAYGIFLDNTHKSFFNFGASNNRFSSFAADYGEMDYYFIHDQDVASIIKQYTALTGRMPLPPKWSIGYQQCRYSYYPDKEVLSIARTFREKDIPADTIVLDIHYMDQYKIFTWSKKDFPDPKGMIDQLRAQGFHVVVMCDPGIKTEAGYEAFEDGVKNNVFIKYPDGSNYSGQVWPGWCHFPDYTNPATRAWWKNKLQDYVNVGIDGFWNDMNEISTWGHMLPENLEMDFEGNKSTIRRGRNVYGLMMSRSTYEGTKTLLNGTRPFNLTRAGFSGIQRYAAVWTGDNVASDEHMMLGIRLVNSMGLSGIAFAGYDVGGFVGDASIKLYTRWLSIASFSPFFRGHTMVNTRDSEPWSYGEEAEQICRNYIKLRYRLLPYIYTAFYEAHQTGLPIQRSLALNYSFEDRIYQAQYQHQYLFGSYLLIAPVESTKELTKVFLPEGSWYSLYTGERFEGNREIMTECPVHRLPVYVKEGAIISMQADIAHTGERRDKLQLHVYQSSKTTAYDFYEDDGSTFGYESEDSAVRKITYASNTITFTKQIGRYASQFKKLEVVLHGFDSIKQVKANGATLPVTEITWKIFQPLEKFDPVYDPEPAPQERVQVIHCDYSYDELKITW